MNKLFLFSILSILFISCGEKPKKESYVFSISGSLSPAKADYMILKACEDIERKIVEVVDTIKIDKDGNFSKNYNLSPHLYTLQLPNNQRVDLAIGKNQDVVVNIENYDSDALKTSISGSKDTDELLGYEKFRKESLDRLVKSVRRQIKEEKSAENPDKEKIAELGKLEIENYNKHLDELTAYLKTNMKSTVGLYATSIRWKGSDNLPVFDSITTLLESKNPEFEATKKLREKVIRLKQTEIGGVVKDINLPAMDSTCTKLSSVKAKYVLVDFWASWCAPCRRESPVLNELMEKYNRDDFDIYGVSLDGSKDKWLQALQDDNRTWTNVSSLERFKTNAAFDYAVTSLPNNFLVDENKRIIAKDLHGEELAAKIEELIEEK